MVAADKKGLAFREDRLPLKPRAKIFELVMVSSNTMRKERGVIKKRNPACYSIQD